MKLYRFNAGIFLALIIISGWTGTGMSQEFDDVNSQFWVDFNPSYYFNPHLKVIGEIGVRTNIGDNNWWRFVLDPSVRTRLKGRYYFTAGVGSYYTFNELIEDRWELAPYQQLDFVWPKWKIPFHHYFRVDERFDFNTDTWDSKNSARVRYKLKLAYKWAAVQMDRYWQAIASTEVFYTFLGEQGQFREQTKVTVGIDRSLAYDVHFRFELAWQKNSAFYNQNSGFSDIYFRFRYTKSWGRIKE